MPRKNTERQQQPHAYYHVYNRGVEKRIIFQDEDDYIVFLSLLKRYLSPGFATDRYGRDGKSFTNLVDLLAFCLMPNHFHLLLYVYDDPKDMSGLLLRVGTAYTMYFNKKYKRVGPLFQSRFRSSMVNKDDYLIHVSRYIHLNPKNYKVWPYSSYQHYTGGTPPKWVNTQKILELFNNDVEDYKRFTADYEEQKVIMDKLKYELADK